MSPSGVPLRSLPVRRSDGLERGPDRVPPSELARAVVARARSHRRRWARVRIAAMSGGAIALAIFVGVRATGPGSLDRAPSSAEADSATVAARGTSEVSPTTHRDGDGATVARGPADGDSPSPTGTASPTSIASPVATTDPRPLDPDAYADALAALSRSEPARRADAGFREAIAQALERDGETARRSVVEAIAAGPAELQVLGAPVVIASLRDGSTSVRAAALRALDGILAGETLGASGAGPALAALEAATSASLQGSPVEQVAALEVLANHGFPGLVPHVESCLAAADPLVVKGALRALERLDHLPAMGLLDAALLRPEAEVRGAAAALLARRGDPGARDVLFDLAWGPWGGAAMSAFRTLSELDDPRAAELARRWLAEDESSELRLGVAVHALLTAGETATRSELRRALEQEETSASRLAALRLLAAAGDDEASVALRSFLDTPRPDDFGASAMVVRYLVALRGAAAAPALREQIARQPEPLQAPLRAVLAEQLEASVVHDGPDGDGPR